MSTLSVTPWPDPIVDTLGHDPRSEYVERFWLPTLGPTTLLLLRRLATLFDGGDPELTLDAIELSQALGLGGREGNSSPLLRSFDRLGQFELATSPSARVYAVRRTVPPVNRRHVRRPPITLQRDHDVWLDDQLSSSRSSTHDSAPAASRSRSSSRATTSTTSSGPSSAWASTPRSVGRARSGPTTGTAPRTRHRRRRRASPPTARAPTPRPEAAGGSGVSDPPQSPPARRATPPVPRALGTLGAWTPTEDILDPVAGWLRDARAIVVLTGAGISTESGIPDFRGPQGLWTKNPAAERKATIQHYVADAEHRRQVWANRREARCSAASPTPDTWRSPSSNGAPRCTPWSPRTSTGCTRRPVRRRRSSSRSTATSTKRSACRAPGGAPWPTPLERVRAGETDPTCLVCGGMLKSATISFGENLVPADLERAQVAAAGADVFLAIGTSLGVYPAAALPELALRAGATLAVLNADETPFDPLAGFVVRDRLGDVLPALVERI